MKIFRVSRKSALTFGDICLSSGRACLRCMRHIRFYFPLLLLQFFLLSLWSVVHVLYSNHFHTAQLLSSKPSSQALRRSRCFRSLLSELKHLSGWNQDKIRSWKGLFLDYQGSFQLYFIWKVEIFTTMLSVGSYFALLTVIISVYEKSNNPLSLSNITLLF